MKKEKQETETSKSVGSKWTPALAESGFTPIVSKFLNCYNKLDPPITNVEAMFVIHLMSFKWDEKMPRPAMKTIAKRMGVTVDQARNYSRSLDGKGYINRKIRIAKPNKFDLSPLFSALENHIDPPVFEDEDDE